MSRSRRHAAHEEEHENHERWLVTYADMITLLMVLFIVMFAMSQVDQRKFNALKEGLAAGFGQSTSVLDGSESILDQPGTTAVEPIAPNQALEDMPKAVQVRMVEAIQDHERQQAARRYADAQAEAERLSDVERRVRAALVVKGLDDDVSTRIDGRGLTVSLVSRHVTFEANLATLSERGRRVVATLAPVLRDLPDKLQIEGHTNQATGKPKYYASDWDLSTARAVTVLRYLNEVAGVPEDRLAAVGFGHVRPLVDPSEPGSQQLNKRVDIVVVSGLEEENSGLLSQAARERVEDGSPGVRTRAAARTAPTTEQHH